MKKGARILVVDDEKEMLSGCKKILEALGNFPMAVSNPKLAIKLIMDEEFDLIFCDLLMPEINGMQVLQTVQNYWPHTPVVMFSAYGTIDRAVEAMKAGAFDFIEKPFDAEHLEVVVKKALLHKEIFYERNNLINQLEEKYSFDNIIGKSDEMKKIFDMIEKVSNYDSNIFITGESGTGKELIARSVHVHSNRQAKPFVPVNCSAFPENLFEAELFGYEQGAFTGATKRKIGLFEYANDGTFFLDEVCEMPLTLQSKLLRTIQDKKLRHVGGNELINVDVRIISATNKNMKEVLSNGTFREDLFYRLNVINIHLPPLRERREDIRLLAEYFLEKYQKSSPKKITGFSNRVLEVFENYNWPGNIRELENVVERAITLAQNDEITFEELPKELKGKETDQFSFHSLNLSDAKQKMIYELEKKYLAYLLEKHNGHVTKMASEAGMTRRNIHRLLNLHGFDPEKWRIKTDEE